MLQHVKRSKRKGLKIQVFVIFTPVLGEMIQFDSYFSNGLVQPPTREYIVMLPLSQWKMKLT